MVKCMHQQVHEPEHRMIEYNYKEEIPIKKGGQWKLFNREVKGGSQATLRSCHEADEGNPVIKTAS